MGTVQRIAREIAKKEDKKNIRKYVHVQQVRAANFPLWHQRPSILPLPTNWLNCTGADCKFQLLSNFGGNIQDTSQTVLDGAEQGKVEVAINGMQCRGVVMNNSLYPVRVELRLIYLPNLNSYTEAAPNTYLEPRFTMFHKTGQGVNGITYAGYNRRALAASDATGVPVTFTSLARKVIFLPAHQFTGTYNTQPILLAKPIVYKRFSLAKYFKVAKKGYTRVDQDMLSNGNYYLVWWSDGATAQQTYNIIVSCNLQYSIKAPMLDDTAP